MRLDLAKVPFSRYGSFLALSLDEAGALWLRDLHGGDETPSRAFRLTAARGGVEVPCTVEADETRLVLRAQGGTVEFSFGTPERLHLRCSGLSLVLTAEKGRYDSFFRLGPETWQYDFYTKEVKYRLRVPEGGLVFDGPWAHVGNQTLSLRWNPEGGEAEGAWESFKVVAPPEGAVEGFEQAWGRVKAEYSAWKSALPGGPAGYDDLRDLAAYLLWSCTVAPCGLLTSPAVYMSKNAMQNIWSWDNAFNALALASSHPDLAWAQFQLFFDRQHESGAFPDFLNDKFLSFNCAKPPVYGWILERYRRRDSRPWSSCRLEIAYWALTRNTDFWLERRVLRPGTLPVYFHGNDSGWDNASVFHGGVPVESPDLAAWLIRQLEVLGGWADELGRVGEGDAHRRRADALAALMLARLCDEGGFFARKQPEDEPIAARDSLLLFLPLLVHRRLDRGKVTALVVRLEREFETPWGLATEAPASSFFRPEGYWLGPVWAAPTYVLVETLREAGFEAAADRLTRKFLALGRRGGMAENFEPLTGEGLSDAAFSWTAGVTVLLLEEAGRAELAR